MPTNSPENFRRPDLEALPTPQADELVAPLLLPLIKSKVSASKLYYQSAVTITTPQTDRANGAAPTRTEIGSANLDYACEERIKRYYIPEKTVKDKGGIAICDKIGGQAAKLSVLQQREHDAAKAILTNGTATALTADSDFIREIKTAKTALLPYVGKLVLALSETAYDNLMDRPEIQKRLARLNSVQPADNEMVAALDKKLLAMILKVDEVVVGSPTYWGQTITVSGSSVNLAERAALLKVAPDLDDSENLNPVFAKTVVYMPEDKDFEVRAHYDEDDLTYNYTAIQMVKTAIFNAAACKVFSGITAVTEEPVKVEVVNTAAKPVNTKEVTP